MVPRDSTIIVGSRGTIQTLDVGHIKCFFYSHSTYCQYLTRFSSVKHKPVLYMTKVVVPARLVASQNAIVNQVFSCPYIIMGKAVPLCLTFCGCNICSRWFSLV